MLDLPLLTRRDALRAAGLAGLGAVALGTPARRALASTVPYEPPHGTATIDTPAGSFEIPLDPQRVIAIEPRFDVERAVALRFPLIAIGGNNAEMQGTPVAPWVPELPADLPLLSGTLQSLESIAAMDPDLIVTTVGDSTEQLAEIAPLLAQDWDQPWREVMVEAGAWTRRSGLIDELLADYDASVADLLERHGPVIAETTVAVVQPTMQGIFATGGIPSSLVHLQVLADLAGRVLPFSQDQVWADGVSDERIGELGAADALLVLADLTGDAALQRTPDDLREDPFWGPLPAIAEGRVVWADWRLNFGLAYTASECVRQWDALYTAVAD